MRAVTTCTYFQRLFQISPMNLDNDALAITTHTFCVGVWYFVGSVLRLVFNLKAKKSGEQSVAITFNSSSTKVTNEQSVFHRGTT